MKCPLIGAQTLTTAGHAGLDGVGTQGQWGGWGGALRSRVQRFGTVFGGFLRPLSFGAEGYCMDCTDPGVSTHKSLSAQLGDLARGFGEKPVRLGEVGERLRGRGWYVLLILLSLPFMTPIPLPLVSTLIGMLILAIGLRLTIGREPEIPVRFRDRELPAKFFPAVFKASAALVNRLEKVLKPCGLFMSTSLLRRVGGCMIATAAVLLLLPLPVPFSNFFPALSILLLASAALVRDARCFAAGVVALLLSLAFFAAIPHGGGALLDWIRF